MSLELFPRLPGYAAQRLWEQMSSSINDEESLPEFEDCLHRSIIWTATGGSRVDKKRLLEIRDEILSLAENSDFPKSTADNKKTQFDSKCSRYLVEEAGIPFPEACRNDYWSYFCIILLPDVTAWRFSVEARVRWIGGMKNTFQNLWRRGYLIGRPIDGFSSGWEYLDRLSQDAFVQILDRTGLSAEPRVARVLAEAWTQCADEVGKHRMEHITREALKALSAYRRIYNFDIMETDYLREVVLSEFRNVAEISES